MLFEEIEILEFNQYQKPDKAPFIIYADLGRLTEKTSGGKKTSSKFNRNKSK